MRALRPLSTAILTAALTGGFVAATSISPETAWAKKRKRKKKKKKSGLTKPKKGLSLGKVAEQQKGPQRSRIDAAIRDFKEERYAPAAVTLHDVLNGQDTSDGLRLEARYHLAKSLYRMKLHHSALNHFNEILKAGPDTNFYGPSLEWCLFIARKIVADDRVLDSVAKYSDGSFPKEYASEFNYLLARHHYLSAMNEAAGAASTGETRVEETTTGGKSLKGDVFGDVFDDEDGGDDDDAPSLKREGKSLSIEEDIFGDEEDEPPPKKKMAKKSKKAASPDVSFTSKEHIEAANRAIVRVNTGSQHAARAKFLEAVLLYQSGQENDALELFKSVVRLTKPGAANEDKELRQLAWFQLARTHFGAKQPSFSIYYYDKMARFTEEWLEALYESSWANFRLGNYEKALGNLLTLHSPFFKDEYFPESHVLKAVVYYENCRYQDAKIILTDFLKRYEPILEELRKMTSRNKQPKQYYEILANLREGESAKLSGERARIMGQILSIALSDPQLDKLDRSYKEIDGELNELDTKGQVFANSRLKTHLVEVLTKVRGDVQRQAGRAVKRKLEGERDQIKQLVQQAVRIEIETAAAEQKRIEETLRDKRSDTKNQRQEFVEWTDDERLVWPFEDEYWRDELGTYELTLANTCRVR